MTWCYLIFSFYRFIFKPSKSHKEEQGKQIVLEYRYEDYLLIDWNSNPLVLLV